LPLFSHDGQKWLPSTNSICVSSRRLALISSVALSTCIPACAGSVHEVIQRPSTLTVHSLQLPCGLNSGW
jgi:hypothetical protein